MAQTEDFVTDNPDLDGGHGRSSKEIRSEIDRTRSDMDETFAALDAKMTPKEIGLELWSLFKGGSSTGAGKLWKVVREHPMPAAVVGLGLGWLLVDTSRKSDGYDGRYDGRYDGGNQGNYRGYGGSSYRQGYAGTGDFQSGESSGVLSAAKDKLMDVADSTKEALSSASDRVGDAADWTKEHASDLGHQVSDRASALGTQAKRQAKRARLGFWQTMEENPLMVGAAVLAVGVVTGLLIPSTDKEDELMGETRDHLLDGAKEVGQQALDKGKHVAEAMVDKVKEEAEHQGLTAEGLADKVKMVAQEVTNTAKEEAKRQNLTPEAALNALKPDQPVQPTQPAQSKPAQQSQPKPQAVQGQQPKPAQGAKTTVPEPELVGKR